MRFSYIAQNDPFLAIMSGSPMALDQPGMLNSLGLPKAPSQTRVVVAMSGGVDSSVVAAVLARHGAKPFLLTAADGGALLKRK